MTVIQVGLVDTTGSLDPDLVAQAAASLNLQVTRDLPQFWNVQATVRHLTDPKKIPPGVWPVRLVKSLPPGEGGVHLDRNNQPYSLVIASRSSSDWTIDASHETIEMLVDPWGNRMQTSRAIRVSGAGVQDSDGEFSYLVEACDPCEDNRYAYTIQGIAVSDFITPHYYDPVKSDGTRYSFAGHIKAPRQLLPGGYISFVDLATSEWQQILFLGNKPQLRDLGPFNGRSVRAWTDGLTRELTEEHRLPNRRLQAECRRRRALLQRASLRAGALYQPE